MVEYYPVVIHKDMNSDYGATVPDLPGCFSTGASLAEVLQQIREAIECHIEGLLLNGEKIPLSTQDYSQLSKMPEYEDGNWHIVEIDLNRLDTKTKLEKSSGNIFADIGLDAPEERLAKSDLALEISRLINKLNISQAQAAGFFGITQPEVSDILNGRLKGFSLEKLMLLKDNLYI